MKTLEKRAEAAYDATNKERGDLAHQIKLHALAAMRYALPDEPFLQPGETYRKTTLKEGEDENVVLELVRGERAYEAKLALTQPRTSMTILVRVPQDQLLDGCTPEFWYASVDSDPQEYGSLGLASHAVGAGANHLEPVAMLDKILTAAIAAYDEKSFKGDRK